MPVTRNQTAASMKQSADTAGTSAAKENGEGGDTSVDTEPPRRDSPDNCSICLGPFNNKSFTSSCAHSFCFVCLKQWSKVKAECPLCKQPFTSIFHNIRSNDSYDIYELPPVNPPRQMDYSVYNYLGGNLTTFAPTHHYFNLSQPGLDADLTLSNFSRFQFRHRRYDRYLNPLHPVHGEHQYSYTSSTVNPSTHVCAASWPRGAEDFRRRVYRHPYMGPPDLILGSENSTYRLTPAMVAASAHRMHRIMPWLTRELRVLLRSHQNVRLAISMIQPLLTQVTIDSPYFSERISPLVGRRSRQFIQEFVAFANSALSMQAFDRKAMYRRVNSSIFDDENTSSSSSDDDVVEVTDISPETHTQAEPAGASAGLSSSSWHSPTPGPSWENIEIAQAANNFVDDDRVSVSSESDDPVFRPDAKDSDSENSRAGSDIVFVKYDKPWNERSPIQLSSDTDGEGRSRKKKRSKHKKKKRESVDIASASGKKGKGHKSSKSRSKEKSKTKSKPSSWDDNQPGSESSTPHKRLHSGTSPERQKKKRHKRSKDKTDELPGHDRDRELVDRFFADAFARQPNVGNSGGAGDIDIPSSSKSKDSHKRSSRFEKDRSKRKKKKKSASRGSQSPSLPTSYKKHHSGHKKSSNLGNKNQESEKRRHRRRQSSRENAPSEHSSRNGSAERETSGLRTQALQPQNLGHSVASTYQPPYLSMPDTVQHIPLNLWVSTWPSLPVSHTFPPPPPSSSFQPPSVPHPVASSGLPVHDILSEATTSAMDSQTISSESSSDSDSDDDDNDSPDRIVSALAKGSTSRTKQWVEANFSSSAQQPSTSSNGQTSSSHTITWGADTFLNKVPESTQSSAVKPADVVSIASDDEDVVICSSASSTKSDSDEVRVIEGSDHTSDLCVTVAEGNPGPSTSTTHKENSRVKVTAVTQAEPDSMPSPTTSVSFQPFKLQRKLALPQNVNPLFSALAHSSDDEIAEDLQCDKPASSSNNTNTQLTAGTSCTSKPLSTSHEDKSTKASTNGNENKTTQHSDTPQRIGSLVGSAFSSVTRASTSERVSLESNHAKTSASQVTTLPTSSSFSMTSSSSESVFGVLPPLQTATAPVTSMMSTSLNYLPYPALSVSTSLSSILPQSLPFVVPQPPPPPPLPLHFPFPPLPSLIPPAPTLFSSVYPPFSQSNQTSSTSASSALISNRDPKLSSSLLPGSDFPVFSGQDSNSETDVIVDDDEIKSSKQTVNSVFPTTTSTSTLDNENLGRATIAEPSSTTVIESSSSVEQPFTERSVSHMNVDVEEEEQHIDPVSISGPDEDLPTTDSMCSNDNTSSVHFSSASETLPDMTEGTVDATYTGADSVEPVFDALDPSISDILASPVIGDTVESHGTHDSEQNLDTTEQLKDSEAGDRMVSQDTSTSHALLYKP